MLMQVTGDFVIAVLILLSTNTGISMGLRFIHNMLCYNTISRAVGLFHWSIRYCLSQSIVGHVVSYSFVATMHSLVVALTILDYICLQFSMV